MDTLEKIYCTGHESNNDALVAALASKQNNDPMATAAMMNSNNYMNNPFAYLIWLVFAMRMWNNNDGNLQNNAIQGQLDAMRTQISDNQNSTLVMDAIRGNNTAITTLANNLNCDFNQLTNAISNVRSGIQEVAGNVNYSSERVINAINLGDANLTSALQNCCCQTQ